MAHKTIVSAYKPSDSFPASIPFEKKFIENSIGEFLLHQRGVNTVDWKWETKKKNKEVWILGGSSIKWWRRFDDTQTKLHFWGAGVGSLNRFLGGRPQTFYSLRGTISQQLIEREDLPVGDLSLLTNRFYTPKEISSPAETIYIGTPAEEYFLDQFRIDEEISNIAEISEFSGIIDKIASSKLVLTTDIGVAGIAHSYGIPWSFAFPTNDPLQLFQYQDFCSPLEIIFETPIDFHSARDTAERIQNNAVAPDLDAVEAACPLF